MSFGLALSILMHAALLGYAMLSISSTPPEPKEPVDAIIADVITESDLNRMRKGVREAKLDAAQQKDVKDPDQAEKQPPKPRPVAAQPPPPAEEPPPPPEPAEAEPSPPPPAAAKAAPPPKAEPPQPEPDQVALAQKLEELALKKAEEEKAQKEAEAKEKAETEAKEKAAEEKRKAEEKKLAEEKRKAEEKKKAEEKRKRELAKRKALAKKKAEEKRKREQAKKKEFDANRLSALLDKTPDPKQAAAANDAPDQPTDAKGPVRGDTFGRDNTISANEASFLAGLMRQAVSRCWNINAGLDGIQRMVVKVEVKLTRDGQLAGQPKVVNNEANPVFRDAADSAVRALMQCAPYILPPDKYEGGWEHMILTFDPARMF